MSVPHVIQEVKRLGGELRLVDGALRIRAPRGVLNPELKDRINESKQEISEYLRNLRGLSDFAADPRPANLPLSYAQERLWLLAGLETLGSAYNIPVAVRLQGSLDVAALERSFAE